MGNFGKMFRCLKRGGAMPRLVLTALMALGAGGLSSVPANAQHANYNLPPDVSPDQIARLERVRSGLFAQMRAQPTNLDVAFKYAALSAKLGDIEGAIATYERMLIQAPDTPRLQLELGALHYRIGAYDRSKEYFDKVRNRPDVPNPVRARIAVYDTAIVRLKREARPISGWISMGSRFQTNANAAPSGALVDLNGFDWELHEDSRKASDLSATVAGQLRYRMRLPGAQNYFDVIANGYASEFRDQDQLSARTAELAFGPDLLLSNLGEGRTRVTLHAVMGRTWLGGEHYLDSNGVRATLRHPMPNRSTLTALLEWKEEEYKNSSQWPTASQYSGSRWRGSLNMSRQIAKDWMVFGAVDMETRNAERDYNSYTEFGLQGGFGYRFDPLIGEGSEKWNLAAIARVAKRNYDSPNAKINRDSKQRNTEYLLGLMQTIPFDAQSALQVQAGVRGVSSNYDLRDYDDQYIGFNLLRSF